MSLAIVNSGTLTPTVGTETDLDTDTTGKTYVIKVDVNALADGETGILRWYDKVLSGGTERLVEEIYYTAPQTKKVLVSPPIPNNVHFRCTWEQDNGTQRAVPWVVLSLD